MDFLTEWKSGALEVANHRAAMKARVTALENAQKDAIASAYQVLRAAGKSQGDADKMARLSQDVQNATKLLVDAIEEYEELNARYTIALAELDAWRSQQATRRAEMQL